MPEAEASDTAVAPAIAGWPFDAAEAKSLQAAAGPTRAASIWATASRWNWFAFPPGRSSWAIPTGAPDERPLAAVRDRAAVLDGQVRGHQRAVRPVRPGPRQPLRAPELVVLRRRIYRLAAQPARAAGRARVLEQAMAFCRWLSTNRREVHPAHRGPMGMGLPRGTATPFSYGGIDTDFSPIRQPGRRQPAQAGR